MAILYVRFFIESFKCALRESGCRIGYEPTKVNRDHFWPSISMDTNAEASALSPICSLKALLAFV